MADKPKYPYRRAIPRPKPFLRTPPPRQVPDQALHRLRQRTYRATLCRSASPTGPVEESSGEGEIYTFNGRQIGDQAFAIGCHRAEGRSLALLTSFVDCDMDSLKIREVKVVFKPTDGAPLPFFTPV
jgi:hypothetical protein